MTTNEKPFTTASTESKIHFFLLPTQDLEQRFATSRHSGVPATAVESLQTSYGPNALQGGGGGVSVWGILMGQFFNAMTIVLIMAFAVSLGIQSWIEGLVPHFLFASSAYDN